MHKLKWIKRFFMEQLSHVLNFIIKHETVFMSSYYVIAIEKASVPAEIYDPLLKLIVLYS